MSDLKSYIEVNKEIRGDPNRPIFAREIKVFDEVDCEIALYEADLQVDEYMEKFRARFTDPEMFESLCSTYRTKYRKEIMGFMVTSRDFMKEAGLDKKGEYDGYNEEDEDGNV